MTPRRRARRSEGRGRLIVLEGLDGAGTTTHAGHLREWLAAAGYRVHLTQEPSRGPIGSTLRLFLSKRLALPARTRSSEHLAPAILALLFAADRLDHVATEVTPLVEEGWIVLSDRYVLSSLAYQSLGCDPGFVAAINALAPRPDLTIWLDVPARVCRRRLARTRRGSDLFEEAATLRRIDANYRRLVRGPAGRAMRVVSIDGDRPEHDVHEDLKRHVARRLRGFAKRRA